MKNKNEIKPITSADLATMQNVDIRTVDAAALVDITTVQLSENLSRSEKIQEYIEQIKNPYCYLCNGMVVKISFSGKRTLEDCLKDAMFGENA